MYLKSRVKLPDVHGKIDPIKTRGISHILSMSMIAIMIRRKNIPITESDYRQGMSR